MPTLARTPEPEVMDGDAQSIAYANADFSASNQRFVEMFLARFPTTSGDIIVDLGCGPADIPIRLVQQQPTLTVWGVDGSQPMLALGQEAVTQAHLSDKIKLFHGFLPGVCDVLPSGWGLSAVISNSLLHHLHDPGVLWREVLALRERAGKPLAVWVVDLMRPATAEAAQALVAQYAGGEPEVLCRDFLNSLHAAFTADEVRTQLLEGGNQLARLEVEVISDRHLCVGGVVP